MLLWAPVSTATRSHLREEKSSMEKTDGRARVFKPADLNLRKHASPRTLEQHLAKFQNDLLPHYSSLKQKLEYQLQSTGPSAIMEYEQALGDRIEFISITSKMIRRDPKLYKSRYEDVFWRLVYPLVRIASDKSEALSSPHVRRTAEELINTSRTAFQYFIETFLVRFGFSIESWEELPALCETCAEQPEKFKSANMEWIRTFLSHCLCSIGDLYRYSNSFDQTGLVLATRYYELAALVRPSDGRAVSCLGIVQKEAGEVFPATFYSLISACKRSSYSHFLKNVEAMKGPVDELCSTFWIETGHPHEGEDPRETIKVFSIHILNLVTRLLVDPEPDAEKLRQYFGVALEYLSATLERPITQTENNWKNVHYTTTSFLHPNLLWKISLMSILIYHLKKNEVSGAKKGPNLNSLCAFVVTMMGKVTRCVVDSLKYWLQYTSFNLVPEPDPEFVVDELKATRKSQQPATSKKTSRKFVRNGNNADSDADHPITFEAGDAGRQRSTDAAETVLANNEEELSMEDFWMSSDHHTAVTVEAGAEDDTAPHSKFLGNSYLQAFLGFMDTQMHLPLVHLFFQWIRCDEEMWEFCVVNFPDIICDIVDIINTVCKPKFVGMYVVDSKIGNFPLEEEVYLRETELFKNWVDSLDWAGYHTRPNGLSDTEQVVLLAYRFSTIATMLQQRRLAAFDPKSRRWVCKLERKCIRVQEEAPKVDRKLETMERLGKAWFAEQEKEEEKGYMEKRADLPKYLVLDTSCLLRRLEWVQRLYASGKFKIVIPAYVLEELDRGKKNKTVRDAIRWMDITTETKDLDRIEIQRWKDMHQFDPELGKDWSRLSNTERSVRVMADCTKFFAEEVRARTDDNPGYGFNILVLTDLDLQSVYCVRVIEQMERLDIPHEIKLMRLEDFMGWFNEGPSYFRRIQGQNPSA